ncbi:MAG: hypothetical protein JST00_42410 [Deltaproteobacteria bacterium]|nr:hypothetical protein [Deltaproteobacteria bacterium]
MSDRSSSTSLSPSPARPTALVPLLYWLLVVAGLGGFTMKRLAAGTLDDLAPLWTATVMGVALGQLFAWRRVRGWLPIAIALAGIWLLPILYAFLCLFLGEGASTWALAFVPAAICAYLSLSERGALVAFWYPAVLWMLVVFDGATPTRIELHRAAPIFVALTAFFAWFLRAREARRARLWVEHGPGRLATPVATTILRSSPLRASANVAWSGLAGSGALVLAAWVGPRLLQTDESSSRSTALHAQASARPYGEGGLPCCPSQAEAKRERTREYFSILGDTKSEGSSTAPMPACEACPTTASTAVGPESDGAFSTSAGYVYRGAPGGTYAGAGLAEDPRDPWSNVGWADRSPGYGDPAPSYPPTAYYQPTTTTNTAAPTPIAQAPVPTPPPSVDAPKPAPTPPPASKPAPALAPVVTHGTVHPEVTSSPKMSAPASADWPSPWRSGLALALGLVTARVLVRIARRRILLRHLTEPYWRESVDQRISNHWERMLIGLRDAGIVPKAGEQPLAFARRVGIEGMTTCATILERARHGVRIEEEDLASMRASASAVYRSARERAGFAGRAVASLR